MSRYSHYEKLCTIMDDSQDCYLGIAGEKRDLRLVIYEKRTNRVVFASNLNIAYPDDAAKHLLSKLRHPG